MGTPVRCSFCGKSQNDVRHVIAGPLVYICDECVVLGAEIVREKSEALPFEAVGVKRAELRLRAFELLKGTGEIQPDGSIKPHGMQMLLQNTEVLVGWALDAAPAREPAPCPAVVAEVCRLVLDAAKRIMSDQPQTPTMSAERLRWTETWRMLIDAVGLLNPAGCHPDDQPEVLRRIATLKGAGGDHA